MDKGLWLLTLVNSVGDASVLADYRFNGWGLKFAACFDNLANSCMGRDGMFSVPLSDRRDFVLEGGGIESDGNGNLMTTATCQLSPNRNPTLTCTDIKDRLMHDFGAKNVVWIENGFLAGDDTDSHIDTLARFAPDNTIVYTCCNDHSDIHYAQLQAMKRELEQAVGHDGCRFKLVELPFPDPVYDDSGCRLPATYSNYLVLPEAVIMPVYNQPDNDATAKMILAEVYRRDVITVDCTALIQQHGSLHCATMQIPYGVIKNFDKQS